MEAGNSFDLVLDCEKESWERLVGFIWFLNLYSEKSKLKTQKNWLKRTTRTRMRKEEEEK